MVLEVGFHWGGTPREGRLSSTLVIPLKAPTNI